MDIQTKKIHFVQEVLEISNEAIVDKLRALLKQEKQKAADQPISIEQYNREIDDANTRMDAGEFISHEEVKKESASWLD